MTSETWHVVPKFDRTEHHTDGQDCPCQPQTEPVEKSDGGIEWVVRHNVQQGP